MEKAFENLVVIDEEPTDPSYGIHPNSRSATELLSYGFIPLDKPPGPTSHQVVAWIRKMLNVKKAGHSGTLDPPATGLLPIGLGEGTKALGTLLLGPKEYFAVVTLHEAVESKKLQTVLKEFTGPIYQRPPQRSAVKRVTRIRDIYELETIETQGRVVLIRVMCQAGTYVRKLVYDVGEVLGVGATMTELRRTRVSHLKETDGLVTLHELYDAACELKEKSKEEKFRKVVRPIEEALTHLGIVVMRDSAVDAVCHGAQLAVPGILAISPNIRKADTIGLYSQKRELVGVGEALMETGEIKEAEKGIAFRILRVIMKPGTYPRLWTRKIQQPIPG